MDSQLREAIDRHQTGSDQDHVAWAKGPFNDGSQARIDGFGQHHAPSDDVVGIFARKSWIAG
jgi:hypothetical protein